MNDRKRPGGLTALAVINFVLAGLGVISVLGLVAFFALVGEIPTEGMDETQRAQIEAMENLGTPMLVALVVLTGVTTILLLASGVGYLKMRRFLGRTLGNVYGLTAIASSVVTGTMFPRELGGGFGLGALIGLIYPLLTLILINTTFKEDLVD